MKMNPHEAATRRSEERALLEQNLAGALIYFSVNRKPYLAPDVLAICPPESFISQARHIMFAIRDVVSRGQSVDLITVAEGLKRQADGAALAVHPADFSGWATRASDLITERSVLAAAERVAAEWRKDMAAIELEEAMQAMRCFGGELDFSVSHIRKAEEILDSEGLSCDVGFDSRLDEYASALEQERAIKPVKTPWPDLTRILRGGILPGELAILAARPGVGKTGMALNFSNSVAFSGLGVLFFSLEMARQQLIDRLVANVGGVDVGAFRQGLTPEEKQRAHAAIARLRGRPLNIIDDTRVTVGEVRRRVRIAQRGKTPVGLVVVDYLQLVSPDDYRIPREQQVAGMSRGFKLMAKELKVPVLLLAQLSRKGEDAGREPILSDLRESGAIEQDADIVIFLHQARKKSWQPDEPLLVKVAKGRSSGVGTCNLKFLRRFQRFEDSNAQEFEQAQRRESPVYRQPELL